MTRPRSILSRALVLAVSVAAAVPATASAQNLFNLEPHPEGLTPAPIVTDASGTGYVAWVAENGSGAANVSFCLIAPGARSCTHRVALPLPNPGVENDATYSVTQAFVVLGEAGEVAVFAPRYTRDDSIYWISTDGGQTFGAAQKLNNGASVSWGSEAGDVAIYHYPAFSLKEDIEEWLVATSNNPYGEVANVGTNEEAGIVQFKEEMLQPSLALTASQSMMLAYWKNLGSKSKPTEVDIRTTVGSPGAFASESGWTAEQPVSNGDAARLTEGPNGIYLMSVDSPPSATSSTVPSKVDVRHWNAGTKTFSAPVNLETVPETAGYLFAYGAIAENPSTGAIDVAYPNLEHETIELWELAESGGTLRVLDRRSIARFSGFLSTGSPMRLAIAPDGEGWLSFKDSNGDELASLRDTTSLTGEFIAGGAGARTLAVAKGTAAKLALHVHGSAGFFGTGPHGAVDYQVFTSPKCTAGSKRLSGNPAADHGLAYANVGKLAAGVYYVQAQYTGDQYNAPSSARCGFTELIVGHPAAMGLSFTSKCRHKGVCAIKLHAPRRVRLRRIALEVNGRIVRSFGGHGGKITLHLRRGSYEVTVLGTASGGRYYAQTSAVRVR